MLNRAELRRRANARAAANNARRRAAANALARQRAAANALARQRAAANALARQRAAATQNNTIGLRVFTPNKKRGTIIRKNGYYGIVRLNNRNKYILLQNLERLKNVPASIIANGKRVLTTNGIGKVENVRGYGNNAYLLVTLNSGGPGKQYKITNVSIV